MATLQQLQQGSSSSSSRKTKSSSNSNSRMGNGHLPAVLGQTGVPDQQRVGLPLQPGMSTGIGSLPTSSRCWTSCAMAWSPKPKGHIQTETHSRHREQEQTCLFVLMKQKKQMTALQRTSQRLISTCPGKAGSGITSATTTYHGTG